MSKKNLILVLLIAGFFLIIPSQADSSPADGHGITPVDMVVLLDTSGSVFPIYNDILNYIMKDIISDYLKYGDTFHLITFDSEPSFILSRQIRNKNDIEYILKDLFLLYPLGKHTDFISALKYLRTYVSGITNNSSREIVILTDGAHNPSSASPYQSVIDPATGVNLFEKEIEELKKTNWKISIVKLPGGHGESASVTENRGSGSKSGATSSTGSTSTSGSTSSIGSTSTSGSTSSTGSTGSTSSTGSTGSAGTTGVTGTTSSTGASDASSGRDGTAAHGKNQNGISSSTDASFGKQSQADNGSSQNSIFTYLDNSNISSSDFNNSTEEKGPSIVTGSASDNTKKSKNNILLISIIIIILLIIIIFLMIIRYYSRSSVKESYNIVRNDIDIKDVDKEGNNSDNINRRPIIMKVANQNDQIVGTSRNIHPFKSGAVKSVGGGNSSYLIFLYKIPGTIASLKFDGEKYIFTPLRPEFFPENGDKEIENPLEKNIKIKTEKQHILSIKFWEYISPLEKINSIMHLTEHRGVPLH